MNKFIHSPSFILASQSQSRAKILDSVGISCEAIPSNVDEDKIKEKAKLYDWTIEETALALAREKAEVVSKIYPHHYVVGADQMMICENRWFDKAVSLDDAKDQLRFIRSKSHFLLSACTLYYQEKEIWSILVRPELVVRDLSDEFIESYVGKLGNEILKSVGCYQVEGMGAQLFEKIEGDIFTIMGLPLLPLMIELRKHGVLMT